MKGFILIDEYIEIIVISLLSLFVGYLIAHYREKRKKKVLNENISELEDEKQKIIQKYQKEIEDLKKEHTLYIEKRKFKYEDKKTQFTKFLLMFDEFKRKSLDNAMEYLRPLISELVSICSSGNKDERKQAFYKFTNDIQPIINEISKEHIKMFNETSNIRLVATSELAILLNEFSNALANSKDCATEMINFMATPEYISNIDLIAPYQSASEESGILVLSCLEKLKNRMNLELDEM